MDDFDIQEQLRRLPNLPGVYMMRDREKRVIYVGKAKNLKNRVPSYFRGTDETRANVRAMMPLVTAFDYIVTDNEVEAFLLECNLIKKYRPHYNILLKDGKTYPYIKITVGEKFPRVFLTRNPKKDGAKYFGPYPTGFAVHEVIDVIRDFWRLRACQTEKLRPKRACLNKDVGICAAPCDGSVTEEEYGRRVKETLEFLNGRHSEVLKKMEENMHSASENMEFERAAVLRDRIFAVRRLDYKQKLDKAGGSDMDAAAFATLDGEICAEVLIIREGKMIGREHYMMKADDVSNGAEIAAAFVTQFYSGNPDIPREILLQFELGEDRDTIMEMLSKERGAKVTIHTPQKGEKLHLVNMARRNAEISLARFGNKERRDFSRTRGALLEIAKALNVSSTIFRIESYDISNTQGVASVGSMVVFEGGKPKRSEYRKFKIQTVEGANDYASMEEVLTRRFSRYLKEQSLSESQKKFSVLPDILFIDGGKGQVASAEKVLSHFGFKIPVCGMIKDDRHRTRGLLFNNTQIPLKTTGEGFKLVTRIQDETHRFAIEYHRKLREEKMVKSALDDITGIGPVRKKALLSRFGSVDEIKKASLSDLSQILPSAAAETVFNFFKS